MALSAACNTQLAAPNKGIIARPFNTSRSCRRLSKHAVASMVSRDSIPEQYKDARKYKLQFVCFTRLAPEQTTAKCR